MTWEDIIQKGPFDRIRERKRGQRNDAYSAGQKQKRAQRIQQLVNEVLKVFRDDPEFQKVGKFGIKILSNGVSGMGQKRGLMYDLNPIFSGGSLTPEAIEENITEIISYLGKLGFTAEKGGNNTISVTKQ